MKKLIFAFAIMASIVCSAAEPKCEVKQEFWGRRYFELTDVNGYVYKLTPPTSGSMRYRTRTGWYLINSDGKIVEYKDTVKGGK